MGLGLFGTHTNNPCVWVHCLIRPCLGFYEDNAKTTSWALFGVQRVGLRVLRPQVRLLGLGLGLRIIKNLGLRAQNPVMGPKVSFQDF